MNDCYTPLDTPLVITLDSSQIHNPPIMHALHGANCIHCGYEHPDLNPTPAQQRHWCRLRRAAIAVLRWTNRDRLGSIELNDAEMQPGFVVRAMMAQQAEMKEKR